MNPGSPNTNLGTEPGTIQSVKRAAVATDASRNRMLRMLPWIPAVSEFRSDGVRTSKMLATFFIFHSMTPGPV